MEEKISFIETINQIRERLPAIQEASDLFDKEIVDRLEKLALMDLSQITSDLKKGNYLGNRKIDIDLRLNNQSDESECAYKSITLTLNNGISHTIEFTRVDESGNSVIEELSSYTAIYTKLIDGIESYNTDEPDTQKHIVNYEIDVINETIDDLPTLLRIRDTDGSACNIDRITLEYYNGGTPIANNPSYFWAKTTSSLEVLANRVGDIIALGEDIDKIIALSDKEDEIQALYDMRVVLAELHTDLSKIVRVYASIDNVDYIVDTLETKMDYTKDTLETKMDYTKDTLESKMDYTKDTLETKMDSVLDIKDDILLVPTKVSEVKEIRDELTGITPEITQLSFGQPIHVTYSKDTGKLSFYIPQGAKGEKGDPFNVDAIGLAADRSDYNNQPKGYAYLATDESKLYFKMSDLDEDNWSIGSPFGKGDTGNGITDIQRTAGDGSAGTVDTYTITLDDGSVYTFSVTNGVDTYTKSEIDARIQTAKNELLGGAGGAYDTLKELEGELQDNDAAIVTILTVQNSKANASEVYTKTQIDDFHFVDDKGNTYYKTNRGMIYIGKLRYSHEKSIASGFKHTIFLLSDGTCKAVGSNTRGQLGDGTTTDRSTPVDVLNISNCVGIACGNSYTIFLLSDGTCKAVGSNTRGQLGDGTTTDRSTPVDVLNISNCVGIACGNSYTIFLLSDGTCKAVGSNTSGQLGDGTTTDRSTPVDVLNISNCVGIASQSAHTIFLLSDGTCKATGFNESGQLGDGTTTDRSTPVNTLYINQIRR
jgi:hypothetical protein